MVTHWTPSQKLIIEGRSAFFTVKDTIELDGGKEKTDITYRMELHPKFGFTALLRRAERSLNQHSDRLMAQLKSALQDEKSEATLSPSNARADAITWRALACFTRFGYLSGRHIWQPMSERLE